MTHANHGEFITAVYNASSRNITRGQLFYNDVNITPMSQQQTKSPLM